MENEEENKYKEVLRMQAMYSNAIKIVTTKLDILNENYKYTEEYSPIEHIKSRVKSIDSIWGKLKRKGLEPSIDNIESNIEDIAGVRVICSFANDVYKVADAIKQQQDIKFIKEKDYIKNPKPNGYRSYHMIIEVPIYLSEKVEYVKVEIQIRTEAMDFWASLEHKAKYKYNGEVPKHLIDEFKVCSEKINELDERMFLIKDIIYLINN